MTTEELITTIRNKVEGQFSVFLNLSNASQEYGYHKALEFVLSVLSDIEKSLPAKVADGEVLEKEIIKCWQEWISPSNKQSVEGVLPLSEFAFYARHFAQWGAEHLKK